MNLATIISFLKKIFNWSLIKETYQEWSNDKASRLAAALAYYTATAAAPLITGILAIAGLIFDTEQAQAQLVAQVRTYVGAQGAEIVETIISNADQPEVARLAGLVSLGVLLWSASNVFVQLQDALNTIWGVELRSDLSLLRKIRHRLFPLLIVVGIGLLLLAAIIASTALSAVGTLVTGLLPGGVLLWQILNFLISLTVITLLFAVVFKVLPDVEIVWRDVLPGAALTALLFVVGQFILSWYLGRQSGVSVYGAAGSLIVLLLWLFYSAQIFLFGAEYTQVYATRYGEGVIPAKDAVGRYEHAPVKAAAQAANTGTAQRPPSSARLRAPYAAQTQERAKTALNDQSLGTLVIGILDDGLLLFRQEIYLAKTEIQATLARLTRGITFIASGGLTLYAGLLIVLLSVSLLLTALTTMPLWIALLLVGLLVLVEGWIMTVSGRKNFRQISYKPKQTHESLREDVEMVKEHLAP